MPLAGSSHNSSQKYSTALSGKEIAKFSIELCGQGFYYGSVPVLVGSIGAMTLAIVKVFPEPVTPSSTCAGSLLWMPSTSLRMACGWSPVGSNLELRWYKRHRGGMGLCLVGKINKNKTASLSRICIINFPP